jgi:hypothetical protein
VDRVVACAGRAQHGQLSGLNVNGQLSGEPPLEEARHPQVEDKVGRQGRGDAPPDDAPGEDVNDEGDVDEAARRRYVRAARVEKAILAVGL